MCDPENSGKPGVSNVETKKALLQCLMSLMALKGHADEMYLELTKTVCGWCSLPEGHKNELTARETVMFLQRLAGLERNGNVSARIVSEWQDVYLKTLYSLCTAEPKTDKSRELRKEAMNKVEAYCLIGLRARSIQWRHLFDLHCKCIGRTPFDCLQYIFHQQDWEALSNTFGSTFVRLLLNIVDGKPTPIRAQQPQLQPLLPSPRRPPRRPHQRP